MRRRFHLFFDFVCIKIAHSDDYIHFVLYIDGLPSCLADGIEQLNPVSVGNTYYSSEFPPQKILIINCCRLLTFQKPHAKIQQEADIWCPNLKKNELKRTFF